MTERTAIGRYDIVGRLGGGELAAVFHAVERERRQPVALKLCTSEDPIVRRRFRARAEVNAGLTHGQIVEVLDLGEEDGAPYLVEEWLSGIRLDRMIAEREPEPELVRLQLLLQVATALDHAHSQGVLHGSLRGRSVWRLGEAWVKVGDFGLHGFLASRSDLEDPLCEGAGAPSPEQLLGREPDARSDVFAFGALAFELLAYRPAFPGEAVGERIERLLDGHPLSLKALWPSCPADLANLVDACLKRQPASRPQGFPEVVAELAAIVRSPAADTFPALAVGSETVPQLDEGGAGEGEAAGSPEVAGPAEAERRGPGARGAAVARAKLERVAAAARHVAERVRLGEVPPGVRRGPAVAVAVALGLAAVVAALALWPPGSERRGGETPAPVEAAAPAPAVPPPAPPPSGQVTVDAAPWGRVVAIEEAVGGEVDPPVDPYTPLRLELPAGVYRISVAGATTAEGEVPFGECETVVAAGRSAECRVELPAGEVDAYFRQAGWWP